MSGMEPMIIGSAIGAMTNRKNPLQGALVGGALGGVGGSFLGGASAGTTGATTAGTSGALTGSGAATAANTAFMNPAGVNAMTAATTGPSGALGVEAMKTAGPGIFSTPTAVNTAMTPAVERPLSLSMPGVEPGQGYQYTLGDRLSQVGQFAQQNPVLTQMAAQTGQSLLNQQPTLPPPAGLMRGNPTQMQPMQYQVGVPRVSLI